MAESLHTITPTASDEPKPLAGRDSQRPERAPRRWLLLAILLVGLGLRLAVVAWWHGMPVQIEDEKDYDRFAVNLVEHGEFSLVPGDLSSSRPPLYPAMLAGIYRIAGLQNYTAVRLVQFGIGMLIVLQVYWLALPLYDEQVALVATAIASFYPSFVIYPALVLTELLFTVLLMAGFLAIARFLRGSSAAWLAVGGACWGLGTLARSVLWPFAPVLALYLWFATKGQTWPRRIAAAAIPALAFMLTLTPWAIRNTRLQQAFTVVDTMGGRNLMMGNYEHTPLLRSWSAIQVHEGEASLDINNKPAWDVLLQQENPGYAALTQGQKDKVAMRRGIKFIVENPGLTLVRDMVKFFNFWQLEREIVAGFAYGYWGDISTPKFLAITVLIFSAYVATLTLGIFGFVVDPPQDLRMHWLFLLVIAFICAMHTLVFAHSRYHLAVMPIAFVYAAAALVHRRTIWQQRSTARCRVATIICLLLAASWVFEVVHTDLEKFRIMVLK